MTVRIAWICWIAGTLAATALIGAKLNSGDRAMFLPGQTTSGHYQIELACETCHTPYDGVRQDACLKCHQEELEIAEDSHPKSKFTDPRNADRVARLDAQRCITCHVEHRPELTHSMGVTLPADLCLHCHSDVAKERPSHEGMAFETCASAGCHNFHDNRALYQDFLVKHRFAPTILDSPKVLPRTRSENEGRSRLGVDQIDAPKTAISNPVLLKEWAATSHARAGVNCTGCHNSTDGSGVQRWIEAPRYETCRSCHVDETQGFLAGKHGMRLAAGLRPMSPELARLPMNPAAFTRVLGCTSCHSSHDFDTRRAAVDACLECHADTHSLSYKASPHFALWRAEISGNAAAGTGVSCATCHLPREPHADARVRVQHNQNSNLRPNEKMIRDVCQSCHGLGFSIDALADPRLIETNFRGSPSIHIQSIDMAVKKAAPQQKTQQ